MALRAYQVYQGHDWQTRRYAVAQAYDTLDQIRELLALLASGSDDDSETAAMRGIPAAIADLCHDLMGEIELALTDMTPMLDNHVPSRWLIAETRVLAGHMPPLAERAIYDADPDVLPQLADLADRTRFLLQRLDQ